MDVSSLANLIRGIEKVAAIEPYFIFHRLPDFSHTGTLGIAANTHSYFHFKIVNLINSTTTKLDKAYFSFSSSIAKNFVTRNKLEMKKHYPVFLLIVI